MNLKFLVFAFLFLFLGNSIMLAQGTNNDFSYDDTDLNFLFTKLGFGAFKFPVIQNKQQIVDFRIEEYRGGSLSRSTTVLRHSPPARKPCNRQRPKAREG